MRAVILKEKKEIVCPWEENLPKEEQTIFTINHLTCEQEQAMEDLMGQGFNPSGNSLDLKIGSQAVMALHFGLEDVKNLPDENGNEISLKRDNSKRKMAGGVFPWEYKSLDLIPKRARKYISKYILDSLNIEVEEEKNS